MKNLMISTALVAFAAVAAQADTTSPFRTEAMVGEVYASDFIGMRVYAAETAYEGNAATGIQDGWNDIGEINDVILSREGNVDAVLVDIGGFLGMGERQVAVNMNALKFVSEDGTADNPEDYFLVMTAQDAMLQEAPAYNRMVGHMGAVPNTTGLAAQSDVPAGAQVAAPQTDGMMAYDGYAAATPEALTAEALTGANVYDTSNENVGEVSELILGSDGQITNVIVDVGGFLGMGEKPVSLTLSELQILRNTNGEDLRVYVAQSKAQLEAMPDYVK
ncbi:PRC-barrel domain-containing protein [Pseudorhodobacter sp.]|uniref:PRC-barrel domain-containing protein n=1 Tax=Pseudorhodobacter sp. TaxID=1934400 RepID=UPI0039E28BBE